jgi:hypothetical protein
VSNSRVTVDKARRQLGSHKDRKCPPSKAVTRELVKIVTGNYYVCVCEAMICKV